MNSKLKVVLSVAVVIAIAGAYVFPRLQSTFGANPGPEHNEAQVFNAGLSLGHRISTTTTLAAYTLTAGDLTGNQTAFYDTILFTKTVGVSGGGNLSTTTLTFPASSTVSHVIPLAGMRSRQCWVSATSSSAELGFVLAAGTGFDFKSASTSPHTDLTTEGGGAACLDFIRQADSDITVLITDWQNAD